MSSLLRNVWTVMAAALTSTSTPITAVITLIIFPSITRGVISPRPLRWRYTRTDKDGQDKKNKTHVKLRHRVPLLVWFDKRFGKKGKLLGEGCTVLAYCSHLAAEKELLPIIGGSTSTASPIKVASKGCSKKWLMNVTITHLLCMIILWYLYPWQWTDWMLMQNLTLADRHVFQTRVMTCCGDIDMVAVKLLWRSDWLPKHEQTLGTREYWSNWQHK